MEQRKPVMHHLALSAERFDDAIRFYEEGLGFRVRRTWGQERRGCLMDMGDGSCLELFDDPGKDIPASGRWLHLALNTPDIHESYRRALAAGAKPKHEPALAELRDAAPEPVRFWCAFVTGCNGEEIEFIQEAGGRAPAG